MTAGRRAMTESFTLCVLVLLLGRDAAASLDRARFCQLYGLGGTADVEASDTLDQCNRKCVKQTMPPCVKTLFYGGLGCCVYYHTEAVYDMACDTLITNGFRALHVSGCAARENPTLLMLLKITPPSVKMTPRVTTTTTTTTSPAPEAEAETTVAGTTEAAPNNTVEEIPDPKDPDLCEELVVTSVQPDWYQLQAKLRNESANYFCHKLCQGPLPPKHPWLKPATGKADCHSLANYDSSLCGSFLDMIMNTWNQFRDGQLTLTLCSLAPLPDAMTTIGGVTDGNMTDVTGDGVTGGIGDDVTTAVPP